jgi:hypothetical protein
MAKNALKPEQIATVNENLDRARGGVAALRATLYMVVLPKREAARIQSIATKMDASIKTVEDAITETEPSTVTKTAVKEALKNATPEQLAAIAAMLAPADEPAPETDPEDPGTPETDEDAPEVPGTPETDPEEAEDTRATDDIVAEKIGHLPEYSENGQGESDE